MPAVPVPRPRPDAVPPTARRAREAEVLTKAAVRAADALGLSRAALSRVIGVSEASVSRMANGRHLLEPGSKPAELALLVVRLYRSLDALVGNDAQARRAWLAGGHRTLGAPPVALIETVEGLVRVVAYLDGARAPT